MEHEQDPQHQTQPNKDDGPVEPRLEPSQPGLGAPSGERLGHAEADAEGDSILARLARQAARIDTLSANLEQHRNEFRDAEVALVTRIADVDDDRRLTATRLQRSWQSYRDEVEDGFKRRRSMLVGILLLFGILVSISLGRVINSYCVGLALRTRTSPSCEQNACRGQMDSRQEIAGQLVIAGGN
ncbi:hypothetical protein, partial [uncultured Thiocystis sp.]|uniref:hypothetical protein n=1 Tax=uncultured Thiocystis sp. TaxID=1202134 RepID=UPI0025E64ACA